MTATVETSVTLDAITAAECPCEYGHYGVVPCTVAVTHRVTGCTEPFNACANAVAVITARLTRDTCVDCGRIAGDCWAMHPV